MLGHKPNVPVIRTMITYPDIRANPFSGIQVLFDPFSMDIIGTGIGGGTLDSISLFRFVLIFEFNDGQSMDGTPSKVEDSSCIIIREFGKYMTRRGSQKKNNFFLVDSYYLTTILYIFDIIAAIAASYFAKSLIKHISGLEKYFSNSSCSVISVPSQSSRL